MTINLPISRAQWESHVNFIPRVFSSSSASKGKRIEVTENSKKKKMKVPTIAVCTTLSYTTSKPQKMKVNDALLREWIRYYLKLGLKVIIYDNNGNHFNAIYSDIDGAALERNSYVKSPHLIYYNYSMRPKLDPTLHHTKPARYDNEEMNKRPNSHEELMSRTQRYFRQGDDKMLTFTQCRFEALAAYGIEHVIVVDFDEFLICPTDANAENQSGFLHEMVQSSIDERVDQMTFSQQSMLNKTEDPLQCMVQAANNHKSPLECFAEKQFTSGGHSIKSFHITNACPLTGFHEVYIQHI
jgi:hypothetical protein